MASSQGRLEVVKALVTAGAYLDAIGDVRRGGGGGCYGRKKKGYAHRRGLRKGPLIAEGYWRTDVIRCRDEDDVCMCVKDELLSSMGSFGAAKYVPEWL